MNTFKFLVIIFVFVLISACSPKYKIVHDYSAPNTESGLQCINQQCQAENTQCQKSCSNKFDSCLVDEEEKAKNDFNKILDQYYLTLESYQNKLEVFYYNEKLYHENIRLYKDNKQRALEECAIKKVAKKHCSKYQRAVKSYHLNLRPNRPAKPYKPTLRRTTIEYQKVCKNSCQCNDHFNQCYVSCGGKVHTRKICIDNCEK